MIGEDFEYINHHLIRHQHYMKLLHSLKASVDILLTNWDGAGESGWIRLSRLVNLSICISSFSVSHFFWRDVSFSMDDL